MHRESQRKMTELARLNEEKDMQKLGETTQTRESRRNMQKQRFLAQIEADILERKLRMLQLPITLTPTSKSLQQ